MAVNCEGRTGPSSVDVVVVVSKSDFGMAWLQQGGWATDFRNDFGMTWFLGEWLDFGNDL